jgi:hypothetical protein
MEWTALPLSRVQFAFTVSFHVFPYDWPCGVARAARSLSLGHPQTGLPPLVRILEDIRRDVWPECRLRDRACVRIRQ